MNLNATLGTIGLAIALLAALSTVFVSILAIRTDSPRLKDLSRQGVYVVFAAVLLAAAALINAFVEHDFSLKYVQRYSDMRQPLVYLIAAFWGGQPGSLLFWVLILCTFSTAAAYFTQKRTPELMPYAHAILMGVAAFFFVLILFVTSPFDTFQVIDPPTDGAGLNPLLQNYWMAIHPPCLLTGYASLAIPFSFGMAALVSGRLNLDWIKVTRRWLLISWLFLSVGNLLGGRWAYEELGWGGYWAWDPVENAAILPWFTSTALLHSVMVQEHRGMLKRWNFFLLLVTFWLSVFGTFLTRSGVLKSVHTFAESGIGPWFLGSVIFIAIVGGLVLAWRWHKLAPERSLDSMVSRESMFLLNNWIFLAFAFVVLWGTIFPRLKQSLTGQESSIGPTWFNRFAIPLALILLLVMAIGTMIAWRKTTKRNVRRNFTVPILVTLVATPIVCGLYDVLRLRDLQPNSSPLAVAYAIAATALVIFNLTVIGQEFYRGVRSRRRKLQTRTAPAFFGLIAKHRRRYGGYLVHIGIVLIIFGISGNAFKVSTRATLRNGESAALGDYLVTFQGLEVDQQPDKLAFFANVGLRQCDRVNGVIDESTCGSERRLRPGRYDFNDYSDSSVDPDPGKVTSEVAIAVSPLEDIYIAPSGMQMQQNVASFEMFVNPFTVWLWIGGIMLLGSALICLWPERVPVTERSRVRMLRPAFDQVAMWLLALLPAALFLGGTVAQAQEPARPGAVTAVAPSEPPPPDGAPPVTATEGGGVENLAAPLPDAPAIVQPVHEEGTEATHIYSLIHCECPGCGGATLDHCPPTCADGQRDRARIDALVAAGKTEDEILDVFVAERGEAALAIPRDAVGVWGVPVLAVLLGAGLVLMAVRALIRARGLAARAAQPPSSRGPAPPGGRRAVYEERLALELSELD